MDGIIQFEPQLASSLPTTHALLMSSNLVLHNAVSYVVLHGSRGPAGRHRADSDIDLSLIVDIPPGTELCGMERLLIDILKTTIHNWRGPVEADLAAVYDVRKCGLKCFERTSWNEAMCLEVGSDCFGLYKIQKGFNGFVKNAGVHVKKMYPCLKIWQRK